MGRSEASWEILKIFVDSGLLTKEQLEIIVKELLARKM